MAFRGVFRVDEPAGQRWELGLDLLLGGEAIEVAQVRIDLATSGVVRVVAASAWDGPERISAESALGDLKRAESVLSWLLEASPELRSAVADRGASYELVSRYDDVLVARLFDGLATWADGQPVSASE